MKFISKISSGGKKGITIVWLALFMLPLVIMFAGLAIDIAYMYHVKNQLQVAADAAALAGAGAGLNGSDIAGNLTQEPARQEAWKFACKNKAAGSNVFLVTKNSPTDCNTPPIGSNLNSSNDANGDIIVGNWTINNSGINCATVWEPAGSGFFCRANGGTGLAINAIKAVARRTAAGLAYDMGPVRVFWGQIFRYIGGDWSLMNATASAIASLQAPQMGPTPICLPSCAITTPLDGQWGYDKNAPALVPPIPDGFSASDNVRLCTDTDSTVAPFGQQFYLNPSNDESRPGFAWTNFDLSDLTVCGPTSGPDQPKCGINPNPGDIVPYITGDKKPPDICNKAICITNGTATGPVLGEFKTQVSKHSADSHAVGGNNINGWLVTVPVVLNCAGNQACPGDPTGRPYPVQYSAVVIITDVSSTGPDEDKKGMRLVGLNNAKPITYTCEGNTKKDPNVTRTRVVTTIGPGGECAPCGTSSSGGGATPHLVK